MDDARFGAAIALEITNLFEEKNSTLEGVRTHGVRRRDSWDW